MEKRLRATLRLQNGMELKGWSFGYDKRCDGRSGVLHRDGRLSGKPY